MTIAALFEGSSGNLSPHSALFRGLDQCIEAADRRARLGRSGPQSSAFADRSIAIVSESQGDVTAEEVANAYRRDDLGCIRSLRPPVGFVLFDTSRQRLVATSDMSSRATLAYWIDGTSVAVSSRVLQLLGHPRVDRVVDDLYLAHLITGFWSAAPGTTVIRGVKRLRPGVALVADHRGVDFVLVDHFTPRSLPRRGRVAWIDAFWEELDSAVARATSTDHRSCLSLSGGLDSSALASVIARRTAGSTPLASLSIVAPRRQADESSAIEVLERAYAGAVHNRRLDCSDAIELSPLDAFELFDDPQMTPLALLPARLRMWQAVCDAGLHTVIDGEGGDELFGSLCSPREALKRHQWLTAWAHLRSKRGERRALLRRAFILPALPRRVQRVWARRRARREEHLPSHLSERGRSDPVIQLATEQFYEASIDLDFADEVLRWLSSPAIVGAFATHRHLASAVGIRLASPLLDRRVIELVLGIPIEWMLSAEYRAFLPEAAAGRVPDEIRTRPKDARLPSDLLRAILGSAGTRQLLRNPQVRERLGDWVRFERVDGILEAIGRGYDPDDNVFWQQVVGIVAFAYWYARASREFGVR